MRGKERRSRAKREQILCYRIMKAGEETEPVLMKDKRLEPSQPIRESGKTPHKYRGEIWTSKQKIYGPKVRKKIKIEKNTK